MPGSAHQPGTAAGSAHPPRTAAGGRGAGRAGRSRTPGREGDPPRSYGKVVPSSWSFLCGSRAPPAGGPASFLPLAFAAHQVPPSAPGRHGAAAGPQEVTYAGSGQKVGGGGRGAGAARPGGTGTPSLTAGPWAGRLRGGAAGPSARPRLSSGRGARGEEDACLPAAGLAWPGARGKSMGSAGLHAPGLLGQAEFSLVTNS